MSYPTFPYSPLPGSLTRQFIWNEDVDVYDSGESQSATAYQKPLLLWNIPIKLLPDTRQNSLAQFWNNQKGRTLPFLIKDPRYSQITSVLAVDSGITGTGTLFLYDTNSWMVRADTTTIGSLFSSLSGFVKLGTNYNYEQDTGIMTLITKASTDIWGCRSIEYFRKARFDNQYNPVETIWGIFEVSDIQVREIP